MIMSIVKATLTIFGGVIIASAATLGLNGDLQYLQFIAQILRFMTGALLIGIAFYLQVIAYDVSRNEECPESAHPVPMRFRWPPFFLGVLVLDRARMGSVIPFSGEILSIAIYSVMIYLLYFGFGAIMAYYNVPSPKDRIPEYIREMLHQLHLLKE